MARGVKPEPPTPVLWRLRAPGGYCVYQVVCRACGGRRGWRTAPGAGQHAAEVSQVGTLVPESYVPSLNDEGVCDCPVE